MSKKRGDSLWDAFKAWLDAGSGWVCVLLVGMTAGCIAGVIDIGAKWMSDLKDGICADAFWFDREHCCWSSNDTFYSGDKCVSVRIKNFFTK